MIIYDLVVNTYEEDGQLPVVTHIFHGRTPEQAKALFRAHLEADKFLRDCGTGRFRNFRCRNVIEGIFPHAPGEGCADPTGRKFC